MSYSIKEDDPAGLSSRNDPTLSQEIGNVDTQNDGLTINHDDSHMDDMSSEKTPLFQNEISHVKNSPTCSMYALTFFAALGGFLFGYDTGVISGALLPLTRLFYLDDIWKEAIVSATVGAAIVGAISSGWFNDKFGRKLVLISSSIIFVAGAVIMAVASEKGVLLVGRLIVGVAIGKDSKIKFDVIREDNNENKEATIIFYCNHPTVILFKANYKTANCLTFPLLLSWCIGHKLIEGSSVSYSQICTAKIPEVVV